MSSYTTKAVPRVSCAFPSRTWRRAPNLPKMSYISSAVILKGRLRTYSARFTSGGSRWIFCARALAMVSFSTSPLTTTLKFDPAQLESDGNPIDDVNHS